MQKSPAAFRTISEVGDTLDIPAHVLRFWESKFPQIKPVKRGGGRRYYRPEDVALIRGIQHLLHEQGLTIRGARKIIREKGVKHITAMGDDLLTGNVTPIRDGPFVNRVKTEKPRDLHTIYKQLVAMRKSISAEIYG